MFSRNLLTFLSRPKIYYETSRNARGGITFQLKVGKQNKRLTELDLKKDRKLYEDNPGVGGRLGIIKYHNKGKIDEYMDEDDFEDMAIDAFDAPRLVKTSVKQQESELVKKAFCRVRRKNFKNPKLPNMVTYIEKQEMKALHEQDPETWDMIALAESFPVTPGIAKKIISSPFRAYTVEQVRKHDEVVARNWQLFRDGKLQLNDELREIYSKSIDRVNFQTNENIIKQYLPKPADFTAPLQYKEYGGLIERYEKHKKAKEVAETGETKNTNPLVYEASNEALKVITEDTKSKLRKKHTTLDGLREEINENIEKAHEVDKVILGYKNNEAISSRAEEIQAPDYYEEKALPNTAYRQSLAWMKEDWYPLRIKIPKHKQKWGQQYRVKDRFYDSRGYFLYRVPGLFN